MNLSDVFVQQEIECLYQSSVLPKYPSLPESLKSEQAEAIHTLLNGKDLLLLLPTSFGKSLVYVVPGLIQSVAANSLVLTAIIAPLNVLIRSAIAKLSDYALRGVHVTSDKDLASVKTDVDEMCGVGSLYIFLSPETLRLPNVKAWFSRINIGFLIVDEGHVAAEWSADFRRDYGFIYEIRACIDCPLGVFTATLTRELVNDVKIKTGLRSMNMCMLAIAPDRPNIFLDLRSGKKAKVKLLDKLSCEVKDLRRKMAKTIIFVTSVAATISLFLEFRQRIGTNVNYITKGRNRCRLVNYYNALIDQKTKDAIEMEFAKPNVRLRCLISTVAFGMGVDIPDVRRVVIWGAPSTAMMLWQEIGRAGRDQKPCRAIVLPFSTPGQTKRFHVPNDCCLRQYMLKQFLLGESFQSTTSSVTKAACCAFCRKLTSTAPLCGLLNKLL